MIDLKVENKKTILFFLNMGLNDNKYKYEDKNICTLSSIDIH